MAYRRQYLHPQVELCIAGQGRVNGIIANERRYCSASVETSKNNWFLSKGPVCECPYQSDSGHVFVLGNNVELSLRECNIRKKVNADNLEKLIET